jgi:hypothetical protein
MRIGVNGPWITKSYLELILERKGLNWHDNDQYSMNLVALYDKDQKLQLSTIS